MILAVPEYNAAPSSPAQWQRYYNTSDDNLYMQVLPTTDVSYPNWVAIEAGAAVRDSMRITTSLTRSQYSARDFQSYLDEIVAYIAEKWGDSFNDFMASEAGIMIVEYVSAGLSELSWYLDRESTEWYISLARIRSNAAYLARMLGYKPTPAVAASATLVVTLTNGPYAFDIPIIVGHQFQGPNGLIFEASAEKVFPAGTTVRTDIGVYQGVSYQERFISSGDPDQIFNLSLIPSGEELGFERTFATINGSDWPEVDFLPYEASEVFELASLTDPPAIRFGNDILGKIPTQGHEIVVDYVATSGESGAFAESGSIRTSLTTLVVNFQQIALTVTNPGPATGGSPAESLDKIKTNAPRYFMSAERLVTKGDYDVLASGFVSISGAVAKASATIIRGVEDDLELQALMDAIEAERADLTGYLDAIKANQTAIRALTGAVGTANTARDLVNEAKAENISIRAKTDDIDGLVTTVQGNIADSRTHMDTANTKLGFLPFQEIIGAGDGTTVTFSKTLAKKPIVEGTLAVFAASTDPDKTNSSSPDGDCDATPGRVDAPNLAPDFAAGDVGKMIRIGGEYRQITNWYSVDEVEYSGPRIYGTTLIVEVFPSVIVGYDDGAGGISGTGIAAGTVTYLSAAVSITFSVAPSGIAAKYGVPIICTYQYVATDIRADLTDADSDADTANTNTGMFGDLGDDIDGLADDSDAHLTSIDTVSDDIDTQADDTIGQADNAADVPAQIQADIDALSLYLDTVLSGTCKANIVRVSCLVVDGNGFYTQPSVALMQDLKTYLDGLKIRCVHNSVVGGDFYVVEAKLEVAIRVKDTYTFLAASAAVAAALDTMFKGRDYGSEDGHLERSEYYGIIDGEESVLYSNNSITATRYQDSDNPDTPPSADANGNLFIADHEVISKWEVIITELATS